MRTEFGDFEANRFSVLMRVETTLDYIMEWNGSEEVWSVGVGQDHHFQMFWPLDSILYPLVMAFIHISDGSLPRVDHKSALEVMGRLGDSVS